MSDQHFLPASYIGRFSTDTDPRWRNRSIWVHRVNREPYFVSAEYVGRQRRLYDWHERNDAAVDDTWRYERRLPEALNALADPTVPLDGRIWAQVLVPFVSSIFIRGLDFTERYEARVPGLTGPPTDASQPTAPLNWHDNTLQARLIEWQRLLAPIMAAKWTVVHGSGASPMCTNDAGRGLIPLPGYRSAHYCFPIDPVTVLVLERRQIGLVLEWNRGKWVAPVTHRNAPDEYFEFFRRAIQLSAFNEIYGPTKESVRFQTDEFKPIKPLGPEFLLPDRPRSLRPYLEDYFRILSIVELDLSGYAAWHGEIDVDVVLRSWAAPIQDFVDAAPFPGGIASARVLEPGSGRLTHALVYLDHTRFSEEEVRDSAGKTELSDYRREPTDALRQLMEADIAKRRRKD